MIPALTGEQAISGILEMNICGAEARKGEGALPAVDYRTEFSRLRKPSPELAKSLSR